MHIEPGVVNGAKIVLSYATASGVGSYTLKLGLAALRETGAAALTLRAGLATAMTLFCFQVLPHHPVGVSEVHLILGSTLFLLFGAAPAAMGLALGLLTQGLLFAPTDLAQYGMNVTSLLAPLFLMQAAARRVIPRDRAYVDLRYAQVLKLSLVFQGGVVAWVAFWALYGGGFAAANLSAVAAFGAAYMTIVLLEPLVDLAVLAGAKALRGLRDSDLVTPRLHAPA